MKGEKVYLTTLDAANAETVRGWVNDPEVHRWMLGGHVPVSAAGELAFFEAAEKDAAERTAFRFEIHARDDDRLLGICGLEHMDLLHRHAMLGIFVAPPQEWGKGFGEDALRTLLAFGFDTLGLHSIRIAVFPENERALALYERLGFKRTGVDRQAWFINGTFRDLVRLDMLEDEYRGAAR